MIKAKYVWPLLMALLFFGCDDNTGALGLDIFPDGDKNITGHTTTFNVQTGSQLSGAVFSKTHIGYVGKFTDPYFGYYEAGFLAEIHCTDSLTFPSVYDPVTNPTGIMVEDKPYATELILTYNSYFGDSLTACRMSVYQLDQHLDKNKAYYTDINPEDYYNENDPNSLLGRKAYSALDLTLSDSVRALDDYYPYVRVNLPNELGQQIIDESRKCEQNGTNFADSFRELLKGIYVKSDYGDGTILYVDAIELNVSYQVYVKDSLNTSVLKKKYEVDENGNAVDSTAYSKRTFAATKEIIQANQFKNNDDLILKRQAETQWTYLKTPAGIYTQFTLPLKEIETKLGTDTINTMKLTFPTYDQTNDYNKYKFSISAPSNILLVREQDKDAFFKENKIIDSKVTYIATRYGNSYEFTNLTKLVTACLAEKKAAQIEAGSSWNEQAWLEAHPMWDKVAIIPVVISYDTSGNTAVTNIVSIQNDLKPGYVKMKGGDPNQGGNLLQLEVVYTTFH